MVNTNRWFYTRLPGVGKPASEVEDSIITIAVFDYSDIGIALLTDGAIYIIFIVYKRHF